MPLFSISSKYVMDIFSTYVILRKQNLEISHADGYVQILC